MSESGSGSSSCAGARVSTSAVDGEDSDDDEDDPSRMGALVVGAVNLLPTDVDLATLLWPRFVSLEV